MERRSFTLRPNLRLSLSLIGFLSAHLSLSHTVSAASCAAACNRKCTASQIHDQALCSFVSYIYFLHLKTFPELRGFIDSVYNPSRHPSPVCILYSSFFHSHPFPLLSPFITTLLPSSPKSLSFSLPHFLVSFLPPLPCSSMKPQRTREDVVRRDLPSAVGKKGRDHQLADGGMQQRYTLEGSNIGLLSLPSLPPPLPCARVV